MLEERRIRTRTPEWREVAARVEVAFTVTARLNVLPYEDVRGRRALLEELLGEVAATALVQPPFWCTQGRGIRLADRVSVGQACSFLDLGGITIGEHTMISPRVTLITEGHPVELADRYDFVTVAPIVIEEDVWIGAAATVLPGVTIGRGAVVGAGTVVSRDVPPMTVVTGPGQVERRRVD